MKKIFTILFYIACLAFVACDGCDDNAIDTKLLLEPSDAVMELNKNDLSIATLS